MRPNRLLFDLWKAQPNGESKYHGGGEYIKTLLNSFLISHGSNAKIDVYFDTSKFMDDWVIDLLNRYGVKCLHVTNNSDLRRLLETGDYTCLYSGLPYDYDRDTIPASVHFIGTIHGVRFAETPTDRYEYKYYSGLRRLKRKFNRFRADILRKEYISRIRLSITAMDEIVCDSSHTKYALVTHVGVPSNDIKLAYCPPQRADSCEVSESISKAVAGRKIILMISCGRWIKNAWRALLALDGLFSKGLLSDYVVVCCGLNSAKLFDGLDNKDRFISPGYISNGNLQHLFRVCDLFLYPTLNEGFGLPPLDALRNGNTCILSGVCSLPELYGEAVYYVNPYSIQEIATRVIEASENPISTEVCIEKYNELHALQLEGERTLVQLLHEWSL